MDAPASNLDLDARTGWPPELRVLIERYPREVWAEHVNLGDLARFWLQIHNSFRDLGGSLKTKTAEFREGLIAPADFRSWFAPNLRTLLTHLHGHHQIEDMHFFPLFTEAEPRFAIGFETLERDHEAIHRAVAETVEQARALIESAAPDTVARAADAYASRHDALLTRLNRHLLDEEDLIVPIILDRGEDKLGL